MRALWLIGGLISLAVGVAGIVLPLVPTVPLVLLAAFCFARSSDRLHDWILNHRVFGPMTTDWRERGAISKSGKKAATVSILIVFGLSVVLQLKLWILLLQALILGSVLIFIWSRPSGSK